ncbi:MAG: pentapeptide repeat-containing protein, partial [Myxococcota bacterium]
MDRQTLLNALLKLDQGDLESLINEVVASVNDQHGPLNAMADAVYNDLSPDEQARVRRLLIALVKPGHGRPDSRRKVPLQDLLTADGHYKGLIERLSAPGSELITIYTDGEQKRVGIARDAILRHWDKLRDWIRQARPRMERRHGLEVVAQAWSDAGHPDDTLPTPPMLAYYEGADIISPLADRLIQAAQSVHALLHDEEARRKIEASTRALEATQLKQLRTIEELKTEQARHQSDMEALKARHLHELDAQEDSWTRRITLGVIIAFISGGLALLAASWMLGSFEQGYRDTLFSMEAPPEDRANALGWTRWFAAGGIPDLGGSTTENANLQALDLSKINFSAADLVGANLRQAKLEGTDLRRANLMGADLRDTRLGDALLEGVILKAANLANVDLSGAKLANTDLRRADLSGANLSLANLEGANLTGANLAD